MLASGKWPLNSRQSESRSLGARVTGVARGYSRKPVGCPMVYFSCTCAPSLALSWKAAISASSGDRPLSRMSFCASITRR